MKEFYKLADELRQLLRAMYPNGYTRIEYHDGGVTIKITNFQPVAIHINHLQF